MQLKKIKMKMRNYMKKNEERVETEALAEEFVTSDAVYKSSGKKKIFWVAGAVLLSVSMGIVFVSCKSLNKVNISDESSIEMVSVPMAATSGKKGVITIPAGTVKANPFLPYRDISGTSKVNDIPAFNLVEPPEIVNDNSDAARVMDTIVSGILYDKYSPSAILNIEGNDYLVKKGDTVNNYKVVDIMQDSVTVKLGANVYKAGIGEILTEGTLNHNDVSNLSNKFGGERQ